MNAPTVETRSAAARAGVTVINRDGSTRRIRGATASIGTSVIDVLFDPESGTHVWTVDGIERSVDWVRWFFDMKWRPSACRDANFAVRAGYRP
ncbi:Uncharacterised protein [Burkholderia pseudomallei]|nr:Uncharacterised protein [Burkholderia pseudomallei]